MPIKCLPSLFASIAASALLLGCQLPSQNTDVLQFGSMAQITSISPDTPQVLRAGERVHLTVDVSYVLTAESGTLKLIVLAADNSEIAQDSKVLAKGSGQSTLEAEFTVPNTTEVLVFAPLTFRGTNSTSAVDGRAFRVMAN